MSTEIQVYRVHESEFPFSMLKSEVCRDCAAASTKDGHDVEIDAYLSYVEPPGDDQSCEVCEGGFETELEEV